MANYCEFITSDYFKVKDLELFKKEVLEKRMQYLFEYNNEKVAVATYDGLYVYDCTDDEDGNEIEYELDEDDIVNFIQSHIQNNEICEIRVVGHEKLRYVTSYVWYITSKEIKFYNLFDDKRKEYDTDSNIIYIKIP